ncbi:MAG: flagellar export chaperone FliS [Pseudidiomarina maritima]|uniref:Flagellar secretion chaperone FliS n=1 Tax=Pseudidiomarina fusca TaxID=2965078 RepID=A0ABU3KWA5_9GAMM|nr:flagellar export chaperone FliS [Pseudidiomarina sp. GXY010]MDT7525735.1 flagellar export chaperone FliS [Pseudidiomarina sp. GXY010]MDX1526724.1 flagellar export chaperone FliS [Pseudidiomarina maritima]
MYGMRGAAAYGRVGIESHVLSASPHKLISLLFDGAIQAIKGAKAHIAQKNIAAKAQSISKALDIVNQGLLAAVDKEQGGDLAERLEALYTYVAELLLKANLHNDVAKLDEAAALLEQIGSAWKEIQPQIEGA